MSVAGNDFGSFVPEDLSDQPVHPTISIVQETFFLTEET